MHGGGSSIILQGDILQQQLSGLPFAVLQRNGEIVIHTDEIHQGLTILMERNVDLQGISIHSANLEDVFLHLTGKKLRE
jgi:hypothetical protein